MQKDFKKVKPSMYISQDTLDKIDSLKALDHSVSGRGEIVDKAVEFYKSHIDLKQDIDYFAPIIKAIVENSMNVYFERLNRNLFKEATELNILTRCVAKSFMIDEDSYQRIRKIAVDEVRKHKGSLNILEAQE